MSSEMKLYLTDEDYEAAERNGISKKLVYNRFYQYGWDVERAVTEPKYRQSRFKKLQQIAAENGVIIKINTLQWRLAEGWTEEDAVTIKVGSTKGREKKYIQLAAKNGISKNTYWVRRSRKWGPREASTVPVKTEYRKKELNA